MTRNLNVYRVPSQILCRVAFDGFRAAVARSRHSGETVFEHHEDVHRIFITLEGQTRATIAEIDALPTVRRPDCPGVVTVVPAGLRRRVLLEDIDFTILDISVSDAFLRLCAEEQEAGAGEPATLSIVQNMRNHWLMRSGRAFMEAGMSGASAMQMQTLAFAMIKHLARSPGRLSEGGGLDPLALARVLQLMQDRLGDDVTLTELAFEAGLSVSAFSRAFAKSLGLTPYRYFVALRMQRAQELLAHTSRSLAEIAGETGYADQAHFTAAFTRHAGRSPGKWRAEFGTVPRFLPISRKTAPRPIP